MSAALLPRNLSEPAPKTALEPSRTEVKAWIHDHIARARAAHTEGDLRTAAEEYRRVLFTAPAQSTALLGLSLIARQTGQFGAALHMAQAAVTASPRMAVAWSNLGDILLARAQSLSTALGRTGSRTHGREETHENDNEETYGSASQSRKLKPRIDEPRSLAATAWRAFERALVLDPTLHAAHLGLGNAAAQREDYVAALGHFTRAADLAPGRAAIHFALAFSYGKLGRHTVAVDHYRSALLISPAFASAWLNLGVELVADGRDQLAPPCYAQAIQIVRKFASGPNPDPLSTQLSAHLNLGHLARGRQRFLSAQASYQHALRLAEAHPKRLLEVHLAFASLEIDQQHFPQAWISLRRAEELPGGERDPETLNIRGILLLAEQSAIAPLPYAPLIEEAIEAFAQAEALGHRTAASNRANALLRLGRVEEALESHKNALRLDPIHPGIRYNLALTQLRGGNFAEGWANYEIRWDFREIHPRPRRFTQPRWFGDPLQIPSDLTPNHLETKISRSNGLEFSSEFPQYSGFQNPKSRTLFLYAEQGLGDTLQFVRYLPIVAARLPGTPILLEVQPPVERLLARSLEADSGTPLANLPVRLIASGQASSRASTQATYPALPEFTHHCPLMSLPALFATTIATVPAVIPYLRAPEAKDKPKAAEATGPAGPNRFSIGMHWAGNPRYRADRERSTTLSIFEPLLRIPGIRWVSLQKGPAARQIDRLPPNLRPVDSASTDTDLADTAATIATLDLVITTDSAVAHLTGALGKPLWLLLPWQSDWRWMQDIATTPWYPGARLWRQSSPGDWAGLIERVHEALLAEFDLGNPGA